eukprot:scaffold11144_cov111-Isochrysis_galbana.AAC.3
MAISRLTRTTCVVKEKIQSRHGPRRPPATPTECRSPNSPNIAQKGSAKAPSVPKVASPSDGMRATKADANAAITTSRMPPNMMMSLKSAWMMMDSTPTSRYIWSQSSMRHHLRHPERRAAKVEPVPHHPRRRVLLRRAVAAQPPALDAGRVEGAGFGAVAESRKQFVRLLRLGQHPLIGQALEGVDPELSRVERYADREPDRRGDGLRGERHHVGDVGEGLEVVMAGAPVCVPLIELLHPESVAIDAESKLGHAKRDGGARVGHEHERELDARHREEPAQAARAREAGAALKAAVGAAREAPQGEAEPAVAARVLAARRQLTERVVDRDHPALRQAAPLLAAVVGPQSWAPAAIVVGSHPRHRIRGIVLGRVAVGGEEVGDLHLLRAELCQPALLMRCELVSVVLDFLLV